MKAIICGHGAILPTLERHRPGWERAFSAITYLSQHPDPLPFGHHIGGDGHQGQGASDRLKFAMALAATGGETVAILDYDVVLLAPLPESPCGILSCETFTDTAHGGYPWGHAPYIASPLVYERLLRAVQNIPLDAWEWQYGDRLLGLAAQMAGVEWAAIPQAITGRNTITLDDVPRVRKAIANGCPCVHGVKNEEVYRAIFG